MTQFQLELAERLASLERGEGIRVETSSIGHFLDDIDEEVNRESALP